MTRERLWRLALLAVLIGMIGGFLALRGHPQHEAAPPGATQVTASPGLPKSPETAAIVTLRISRDQSQSQSLAELTQISEVASSATARSAAGSEATQLAQTMREEQEADAVLAAHQFTAATVIENGSAEILVAGRQLSLAQVQTIAALVEGVTNLPAQAIRIVPQG